MLEAQHMDDLPVDNEPAVDVAPEQDGAPDDAADFQPPAEEIPDGVIEAAARKRGWNENYDGPNKVSAKEFLDIGDNIIAPKVAKSRKRLEEKDSEIAELRAALADMAKGQDKTLEMQQRILHNENQRKVAALEAQVAQYEAAIDRAIEEGDTNGVKNLLKQQRAAEANVAEVKRETGVSPDAGQQDAPPPEIVDHVNSLKQQHVELFADADMANAIGGAVNARLIALGDDASPKQTMAIMTEVVNKFAGRKKPSSPLPAASRASRSTATPAVPAEARSTIHQLAMAQSNSPKGTKPYNEAYSRLAQRFQAIEAERK